MKGNRPTKHREENQQGGGTWKRLLLPTLLTIAIGSIYARSALVLHGAWDLVGSASVQLDSKPYRVVDNQDGSAAKLGISPYYFVDYSSADGKEHWIPLANKKGSAITQPGLPTIDADKHAVRFMIVLKNHRHIPFDESNSRVVEGNGCAGAPVSFRALSVPREGLRNGFHPADVDRIELEIRPKRT